jgi:hypothetical protein
MLTFSKIVWILATILCAISVIWYLLGSTANFQRSIDLVTTFIFIYLWIPSLILVVISTTLLLRGWNPSSIKSYVILWIIILIVIQFSLTLYKGVNTTGWLNDHIRSDPLKITSDGKYEYRIELINLFQKNSRERLYVRNVSTGEEIYITVEINTDEVHGIREINGDDWAWGVMNPTDVPDHYELNTTKTLPVPQKRFLIDLEASASRILK